MDYLVEEVLRDRLRKARPELLRILHQRASDGCQSEGLTAEAIEHALAARDYQRAADYIESVAVPLISQGRISGPQGWLEELPTDVIHSRPWLCIGLANVRSAGGQLAAVCSPWWRRWRPIWPGPPREGGPPTRSQTAAFAIT